MKSRKISEWQRKIANGKRKQAEKIQREKDKVWEKLKHVDNGGLKIDIEIVRKAVSVKSRKITAKWTTIIEDISLNNDSTD